MKLIIIISAICIMTSCVAFGQYIEAYIPLPDSLRSMQIPNRVLYNPIDNRLFVGSEISPWLLVVDGTTRMRIGRTDLPQNVTVLCHNPIDDKLYCACYHCRAVFILDGSSGVIRSWVATSMYPVAMVHDPVGDKLFCAVSDGWSGEMVVIDGASDSVLARFDLETPVLNRGLCYNPVNRKVYALSSWLWCAVVDAVSDSLRGHVFVGGEPAGICYNPVSNTIYCSVPDRQFPIRILDGVTDSLIDSIPMSEGQELLRYNPANRYVYAAGSGGFVCVIDAATHRVVDSIDTPGDEYNTIYIDSTRNRIYLATSYDGLVVIDGITNEIVAVLSPEDEIWDVCCDGAGASAYYPVADQDRVFVVDASANQVVDTIVTGEAFGPGCYNPVDDKAYGRDIGGRRLSVLDGATNQIHGYVNLDGYPRIMTYASRENKVYATVSGTAIAIDGTTDSIVARIPVGYAHDYLAYNPFSNKLYCSGSNHSSPPDSSVRVIDCATNTLVADIKVGRYPEEVCVNTVDNKVYCISYAGEEISVFVIDGRADTVVTRIQTGEHPIHMAYNPASNGMYCTHSYPLTVAVIDGSSDSVRAIIPIGVQPGLVYCSSLSNKVYVGVMPDVYPMDTLLTVIDGTADTVLRQIPVGWSGVGPYAFAYDSIRDRLYVAAGDPPAVFVIDCRTDSIAAIVQPAYGFSGFIWNWRDSRLYCTTSAADGVITIIRDASAVAETNPAKPLSGYQGATILRGILVIPQSAFPNPKSGASLFNITGRKVLDLHPGANDIRCIAPGVYFIRFDTEKIIKKLIVTR